ncbi:thioredoxin [Neolewinella agarilytica]|uniref:thioredoxin n=1 Tax=Neolewinella agarilytica TaxID=478744 RepID=UPI00235748EE|nr:thioredoxin [Neolewinella agarilytica]
MKSITSNKQFNAIVASGRPFVLDFYADWCGPCQALLPTVEKLADEFSDSVDVYKINIDEQRDLAAKFQVRSIPSLFFMKSNKIKDSLKGMASEHQLRKKIKALA